MRKLLLAVVGFMIAGTVGAKASGPVYTVPSDYEKMRKVVEGIVGTSDLNSVSDTKARNAGANLKAFVEGATGKSTTSTYSPSYFRTYGRNYAEFIYGATGKNVGNTYNSALFYRAGSNYRAVAEGLNNGLSITNGYYQRRRFYNLTYKVDQTFYDMYLNPNGLKKAFKNIPQNIQRLAWNVVPVERNTQVDSLTGETKGSVVANAGKIVLTTFGPFAGYYEEKWYGVGYDGSYSDKARGTVFVVVPDKKNRTISYTYGLNYGDSRGWFSLKLTPVIYQGNGYCYIHFPYGGYYKKCNRGDRVWKVLKGRIYDVYGEWSTKYTRLYPLPDTDIVNPDVNGQTALFSVPTAIDGYKWTYKVNYIRKSLPRNHAVVKLDKTVYLQNDQGKTIAYFDVYCYADYYKPGKTHDEGGHGTGGCTVTLKGIDPDYKVVGKIDIQNHINGPIQIVRVK